jgi:SAM-dependent methyltransferase
MPKSEKEKLIDLISGLDDKYTPELSSKQERKKYSRGEYRFVPLSYSHFYDQIVKVKELISKAPTTKLPSFIDVGSGIGTKLLFASKIMRCSLTGIEITRKYIEIAKKIVPQAKLIHKDALRFDYSAFDIIYFYRPLCDAKKQRELENRIVNTAKSGAYILPNCWEWSSYALWGNKKLLVRLGSNFYQKV